MMQEMRSRMMVRRPILMELMWRGNTRPSKLSKHNKPEESSVFDFVMMFAAPAGR